MKNSQVDIIIPVFNEQEGLPIIYQKLSAVFEKSAYRFRIIFVNDGSSDGSLAVIDSLAAKDPRVTCVDLSRNFGQQIAVTAGLSFSDGDCAIVMDADLEDTPDIILKFLEKWEEGWEVVIAIRGRRQVGIIKRLAFNIFHFINRKISGISIESAGTFGLMDKNVVRVMKDLEERNRYFPGLRSWAGFKQTGILVDRGERYDKKSRVGIFKLVSLAMDSFVGFSRAPLKFASWIGVTVSLISFLGIIAVLMVKLFKGFAPKGWASMTIIVLMLNGIQLICIGVMGEYIGRILEETKRRPLFVVRKTYGLGNNLEGSK